MIRENQSRAAPHVLLPGIRSAPSGFSQGSGFHFDKNTFECYCNNTLSLIFSLTFLLFTLSSHFLHSVVFDAAVSFDNFSAVLLYLLSIRFAFLYSLTTIFSFPILWLHYYHHAFFFPHS